MNPLLITASNQQINKQINKTQFFFLDGMNITVNLNPNRCKQTRVFNLFHFIQIPSNQSSSIKLNCLKSRACHMKPFHFYHCFLFIYLLIVVITIISCFFLFGLKVGAKSSHPCESKLMGLRHWHFRKKEKKKPKPYHSF